MLKCANLDHSLKVGTNGEVAPCCLIQNSELKDSEGNVMNVKSHTFSELSNSPTLTTLRSKFYTGEKPVECSRCWKEEEAGIKSKRLRDNGRVEKLNLEVGELYFVDLQLGNICNLACRSCGVAGTKKWKEDHKLVVDKTISDTELNKLLKTYSDPFDDTSLFWTEMDGIVNTVGIIDLYGGEPMLMKKQWEFLKKCVELGTASNQTVQFNTNGTIFSKEHINVLKHFKQVNISFSIDNIGDKFNYIRHLGNWDEVKENLIKWKAHTNTLSNFWLNICYTVSTYNLLDFPEMASFAYEYDFDIYTNYVHNPEYFCITNIPSDIKDKLKQEYSKNWGTYLKPLNSSKERFHIERIREFSDGIVNFMYSKDYRPEHWRRFSEVTKILDKSRGQNFDKTFPILSEILHGKKLL